MKLYLSPYMHTYIPLSLLLLILSQIPIVTLSCSYIKKALFYCELDNWSLSVTRNFAVYKNSTPEPARACGRGGCSSLEERVADTVTDDEEQFECQELLECQVQLGAPEEEGGRGPGWLEAEAVAAGWMLDFPLPFALPGFP